MSLPPHGSVARMQAGLVMIGPRQRCCFLYLRGVAVLPQAEASDQDSPACTCMKHCNFELLSALQFTKALVL